MKEYNRIGILYEDNHLLVAVKPHGMLSQADDTGDADILTLLKEYIKISCNKPGNVYLGLVHRLDRPVGGLMVFAKTSKAAARLSEQIRERNFRKSYIALVHGLPNPSKATLQNHLVKDHTKNIVFEVSSNDKRGTKAILDYEVMDSHDGLSLLKIELRTGRPHQIRAQLAFSGCPIYGDKKYGSCAEGDPRAISLWSAILSFMHPTRKVQMEFKVDPPSGFGEGSCKAYKNVIS